MDGYVDKMICLDNLLTIDSQVIKGYKSHDLVLPLPCIRALVSDSPMGTDKRKLVIHMMETCVITWMKQVKVSRSKLHT